MTLFHMEKSFQSLSSGQQEQKKLSCCWTHTLLSALSLAEYLFYSRLNRNQSLLYASHDLRPEVESLTLSQHPPPPWSLLVMSTRTESRCVCVCAVGQTCLRRWGSAGSGVWTANLLWEEPESEWSPPTTSPFHLTSPSSRTPPSRDRPPPSCYLRGRREVRHWAGRPTL